MKRFVHAEQPSRLPCGFSTLPPAVGASAQHRRRTTASAPGPVRARRRPGRPSSTPGDDLHDRLRRAGWRRALSRARSTRRHQRARVRARVAPATPPASPRDRRGPHAVRQRRARPENSDHFLAHLAVGRRLLQQERNAKGTASKALPWPSSHFLARRPILVRRPVRAPDRRRAPPSSSSRYGLEHRLCTCSTHSAWLISCSWSVPRPTLAPNLNSHTSTAAPDRPAGRI